MSKSGFEHIGVCGIGTMGNGIAQVCATSGFTVTVMDVDEAALERGVVSIEKSLSRLVKSYQKTDGDKGLSPEESEAALERISTTTSPGDLSGCDAVIEAIVEKFDAKAELYHGLTDAGFDGILASNTSSISITKLAAEAHDAERFMGMHFMNPVPVQKGVELIRGFLTSDATAEKIEALTEDLGKIPIPAEDKAGFMVNRIWIPFVNEAVRTVEEGLSSVEDVDKITHCVGHRMGPLTSADFVGLDIVRDICDVLEDEFGDAYKAAPLLKRLVDSGQLGKKTGSGFYIWEEGRAQQPNPAVERFRIG